VVSEISSNLTSLPSSFSSKLTFHQPVLILLLLTLHLLLGVISNGTLKTADRTKFFFTLAFDLAFPELRIAVVTMAVALIIAAFEWVFIVTLGFFPIRPFFPVLQILASLTKINRLMVRALPAGAVPTLFTLAVHIPIAAVSAKLALTGPGTYSGALFIIIFDPVSAFILFTKPLKDTLAALLAVDVIRVFDLISRCQEIVDLYTAPGAIGNPVFIPQLGVKLFATAYTPAKWIPHS
jgi:hypothetical protein